MIIKIQGGNGILIFMYSSYKMTILTRKEAAKYLKIGLASIDKIIKNPRFDGKIQIGRRILIDKDKLDKYIENNMM